MKKHLILILLSTVFFVQKSNSQVNNLTEFLDLSELPEFVLTKYLEVNWELHQPTETIENGRAISTHTFTYNYNQKKQVLKRVINMDLNTAYKIRSTTFISDDLSFLDRIEKSLSAKEFFEVGNEDGKKLYEDGNRMLFIERDFHKKAIGLYKITVMYKDDFILYAEKSNNSKSESTIKSDNIRVNQKWNIKGIEEDDLGTFNLKVYENWDCYIELYIKGKLYKSSKCDSENETALLVSKTDTLSIEYSTPELVDANIDILGNDVSFDYMTTDEEIIEPAKDKIVENVIENNKISVGSGGGRLMNEKSVREIVYKPKDNGNRCGEKGKIVLSVLINNEGNYEGAKITKGTTTTNPCLTQHSLSLAKKYKWKKNTTNNSSSTVLIFEY
ncbi:hypothetical protein [Lacinutrix sp. Hel_I_90]|uniref:hypothetical protein n=1 Tax=Lacinutrix sp. Hel_I_90 TaxID=1249999 RepID=UPI0005C9F62C|nr:hypothetical protein [Lacinutrix sp. Hel_I_90]